MKNRLLNFDEIRDIYGSSVNLFDWLSINKISGTEIVEFPTSKKVIGSLEEVGIRHKEILEYSPNSEKRELYNQLVEYDKKTKEFYNHLGFELIKEPEEDYDKPIRDISFENKKTNKKIEVCRTQLPSCFRISVQNRSY